jgi:hypothetical protein
MLIRPIPLANRGSLRSFTQGELPQACLSAKPSVLEHVTFQSTFQVSWCLSSVCTTYPRMLHIFRRSHLASLNNLTRVQPTSYHSLVPWTQNRFFPKPPTMSGSECSLLEEQTLGRLQSFSESATPPRVPRSIALINQGLAIGYAFVLSGTLDLIFYLGSTRPFNGG